MLYNTYNVLSIIIHTKPIILNKTLKIFIVDRVRAIRNDQLVWPISFGKKKKYIMIINYSSYPFIISILL